jgi:hypothetical protein
MPQPRDRIVHVTCFSFLKYQDNLRPAGRDLMLPLAVGSTVANLVVYEEVRQCTQTPLPSRHFVRISRAGNNDANAGVVFRRPQTKEPYWVAAAALAGLPLAIVLFRMRMTCQGRQSGLHTALYSIGRGGQNVSHAEISIGRQRLGSTAAEWPRGCAARG